MKKLLISLVTVIFLCCIIKNINAQVLFNPSDTNLYDIFERNHQGDSMTIKDNESEQEEKRFETFWSERLYPYGDFRTAAKAYQTFIDNSETKILGGGSTIWKEIGPKNETTNSHMGRLQAIAFDPDNASTIFVGSPLGGVFVTYDDGAHWTNYYTDDNSNLPFKGVQDLVCRKDNITSKKYLFAATGDGDGLGQPSIGMYRIELGTGIWKEINNGLFFPYENIRFISKILVHPSDPKIMYIGTTDGVYKDFGSFFTSQICQVLKTWQI